ncbi:MAG: c-type cytochrome [Bacteroidia bacterium]|nr:c-type cytochrome [Bacteroidia bacterium]
MIKLHYLYAAAILGVTATMFSCEKLTPQATADNEILDGPMDGLSGMQLNQFFKGDAAFSETFTATTGLGSVFVASSCISCHAGDGKGHPTTTLTRFGQTDSTGNHYLHQGGPQLQNRALPGFTPEVLPAGASFSKFTAPAVTGLGLLATVSEADLLAMTDPNDIDGDGISGTVNWIDLPLTIAANQNAITQNGKYIGRFGKKASTYNLLQQTITAYNQDMGITSTFDAKDVFSGHDLDPEVSNQTIHDVVFYLHTLKAPIQRNQNDAEVIAGKKLFIQIKCASCHKTELKSGYSPIEVLSNKSFYPYTDLLLHDMGHTLDDAYTEGSAHSYEWRTPALWGLGLSPDAQGGNYFLMHDGRANSIEAAILLHGGEGASSKSLYQNLSANEKAALIKFLESL